MFWMICYNKSPNYIHCMCFHFESYEEKDECQQTYHVKVHAQRLHGHNDLVYGWHIILESWIVDYK